MLQAQKAIRVHNLAMAFRVLAKHPDETLDAAFEVTDDDVIVIESNLHKIAAKLNGSAESIGAEIEAWIDPIHAPPIHVGKPIPDAPFVWDRRAEGDSVIGKRVFACSWNGITLRIEKRGPANYEGFVNGEHFAHGKFKKNLRERLEDEAAKRVNA